MVAPRGPTADEATGDCDIVDIAFGDHRAVGADDPDPVTLGDETDDEAEFGEPSRHEVVGERGRDRW